MPGTQPAGIAYQQCCIRGFSLNHARTGTGTLAEEPSLQTPESSMAAPCIFRLTWSCQYERTSPGFANAAADWTSSSFPSPICITLKQHHQTCYMNLDCPIILQRVCRGHGLAVWGQNIAMVLICRVPRRAPAQRRVRCGGCTGWK